MMPIRDLPIMEYVHFLEEKIRKYQREGVRVSRMVFWWGFLAGSVIMSTVWFVIRLKG